MSTAITTPAPHGTRCTQCPCCDAEIVIEFEGGKESYCAACDEGTHQAITDPLWQSIAELPYCAIVTMIASPEAEKAFTQAIKADAKTPVLPPPSNPTATPKKETTLNTQKSAITNEQIRAIKDAPATEKPSATAKRLGITPHLVYYWAAKFKKEAGVKTDPKPKPAKPAATQIVKAAPKPVHANAAPAKPSAAPAIGEGQTIEVTLKLTEGTLDYWWSKLPLSDKAAIMGDNYLVNIDSVPLLGTVS
jgi:transposase-like protein